MNVRSTRRTAAIVSTALVMAAASAITAPQVGAAPQVADSTYIVLYDEGASSIDAASTVTSAGGTLVANYSQIGVVIARSSSANFASAVQQNSKVSGAASTAGLGTKLGDVTDDSGPVSASPAAPTWGDSLSGLQWDMQQIHVPEAHAITGGSPNVVVGDIDTGLDYTHPDLAANVDFTRSASCIGGAANTSPTAWADDNGHGTHTAGTIAAAANGIGIVGVAPNVKLAGIKAGNAAGFFFPEAVVCAFMWAGNHGIDITNNSYFADPWLFNCKNDPEQRAIWIAERRAIQFAQSNGTLVVAAEGNQADDLSHPTVDATSPDDTTPVTRDISNACAVVPVEVPGVVGVSATGNLQLKSFYSSYGISTVDVAAPGGDSILQRTAAAPNGRVLSTWPASLINTTCLPARRLFEGTTTYCYQQGTSMASPHAAGVAALLESVSGKTGAALSAALQQATNALSCPTDTSDYDFFPAVDGGAPQTCQGGADHNSWFGSGEVDALKAVS
jgi:lantibiotic leader peptide-processing serine protease